jgi:hypothetical protein
MASYIFQRIAQRGKLEGIDDTIRQRDTRTWFRNAAQEVSSVNSNLMMRDKKNSVSMLDEKSIGSMYMFFYDPKHKDTLPYYDIFPLVIPIGFKAGGFLGLNLHYLPPYLRAVLMDKLYQTISDQKYNEATRLKVSYQLLNGYSKFRYYKPCVKQYLFSHVGSAFLQIQPRNWDMAIMLPTERFQKKSKNLVWKDSKELVD